MKKFIVFILAALLALSLHAVPGIRVSVGASRNFALSHSSGYLADGASVSLESSFGTRACTFVASGSFTTAQDIDVAETSLTLRREAPVDEALSLFIESGAGIRFVTEHGADASLICHGGVRYTLTGNMELCALAGIRAFASGAVGFDASVAGTYRFS